MEGIRIVKEKSVRFGRPKIVLSPNTSKILDKYINHEITNTVASSNSMIIILLYSTPCFIK